MTDSALRPAPEDIIPASKAGRIVRICLAGLWRWVLTGKLRGWKRGGRLFVSKADIQGAKFQRGELRAF